MQGRVSSHRQSSFEQATRSLAPLTPSAALHFALLASSFHMLAHSLCSLPRGTVEILEYVFRL